MEVPILSDEEDTRTVRELGLDLGYKLEELLRSRKGQEGRRRNEGRRGGRGRGGRKAEQVS